MEILSRAVAKNRRKDKTEGFQICSFTGHFEMKYGSEKDLTALH